MTRSLPALASLLFLAACGDATTSAFAPLNLEAPVDVAFGCYGELRILGDNGVADESDEIVLTAHPMEACRLRSLAEPERPVGQEDLAGEGLDATYFGFVLQSVPGTVALIAFAAKHPSEYQGFDVRFVDADDLIPGRNSIAVGTMPVAIAADRAGCQMVTANAGSCDLTVFDVNPLVDGDPSTDPVIRGRDVVNASGAVIAARPAAMIAEPVEADQEIGAACPAEPEGLLYIAYPDCHLVAAVRAGTGEIEATIRFEGGLASIGDGDVSCPAQCGGGGTITEGERPVTLDLVHDPRVGTRRLVIGSDNANLVTLVELDDGYLPTSLTRIELEGDVGVIDVALSPQIGMGGSDGIFDDTGAAGGQHQFIYAVATDRTVRVAETLGTAGECDAQTDPRYLRDITTISQLSCLKVGDPATPPRRPLARSPGIELPNGGSPLAVTIVPSETFDDDGPAPPGNQSPAALVGYFAFVTSTTGETAIINVDDDNQRDIFIEQEPLATMPHLSVAHQVRDAVSNRFDELAGNDDGLLDCTANGSNSAGGPRLTGGDIDLVTSEVNPAHDFVLPNMRLLRCEDLDGVDVPITELSFAVPGAQRDAAFPDPRSMPLFEVWNMVWEGPLSNDEIDNAIDGPVNRLGVVDPAGDEMHLIDASRPFCEVGAQEYDIAVLTGCDPSVGDLQCGLGEICYVHPASTVGFGSCLPEAEADQIAGNCEEFLTSLRRYSIVEATAGEVTLVPRRRNLATTPLDGCLSDAHCEELALFEAQLGSDDHPIDDTTTPPARTYSCEADPTRAPGIDRCVMTCETTADCDNGTICDAGYCVEGVVPRQRCVPGAQRYQIRAGDAFAVIGSESGYLHDIVEDPGTGACVADPTASPLLVGRIPLDAPPCTGDGITDLTPNPCSTTIEHFETIRQYDDLATCEEANPSTALTTRDAPAIRFRNPMMTFHLVDPWYPGDANCLQDRAGDLGRARMVHPGYTISLEIALGFFTQVVALAPSVFPVNVARGPENSVWILDEGEGFIDPNTGQPTRGQAYRVDPGKIGLDQVSVVR